MHRPKGRVAPRVEGESDPVPLPESVGDLQQLVAAAAVGHHGDVEAGILCEARKAGEARVESRLAAPDQDHRPQAARDECVDRGAQHLLPVAVSRVEGLPVDAVVAAVVAGGREIEVDRDRRAIGRRRVRRALGACAGEGLAPAHVVLDVPSYGRLTQLGCEVVDRLGHEIGLPGDLAHLDTDRQRPHDLFQPRVQRAPGVDDVASGDVGDADRERGLALGANAYLVKPFTPDALRDQVARYLKGD